ncbi:type VI secretion system baseplate subunit TssG [Defluviimonas sp. WL0075]|uniref:Type VI secretion system baseplate subunit TssG n=1 Tax=Albidovulum sediminicola TaxID=2984331 RepID=A0ABT2Z033_9RHOB|nr:type VI secretion system baseplate subunit TssG [Defluviimonas sp. WL0075]MCV2864499.1 type VI secretion system baseplate subunit TssG [Defluviimonas sp. WL0075]
MASGEGARPDHLTHLAQLTDAPQSFHIFHALRVIEAAYPASPRLGESRRPSQDRVRLGQEAELAFPPSTIAGFEPPTEANPGRLTNRFFGLFGPQGPLPLHMTEYARDRQRNHRDPTFVAFANMLTHRMMGLLYRAWSAGQPAPSFDRPQNDPVQRKVAAISGHVGKGMAERDPMPDLAKRYFAGHLSVGAKNAEGLVAVLSAFFRVPVHLRQFVGSWLELEADDRWQLGARAGLGQATSIGQKVWSRSAKFRVMIGPLTLDDYRRLLPGGASLARVEAVVRNYIGDTLDWDVNLILKAEEVPRARLGADTQLGQTSWIGRRAATGDADDLCVVPRSRLG